MKDFSVDYIEMFDGPDLVASELPGVADFDMDRIIQEIDEKKGHTYAGEAIAKLTARNDFLKDLLDFEPAIPSGDVGVVPSARPDTSSSPKPPDRKKIEAIVAEFLEALGEKGTTNYTREAVASLIDSMERYISNQVKSVRSELRKKRRVM
jgi:hypothetical protein